MNGGGWFNMNSGAPYRTTSISDTLASSYGYGCAAYYDGSVYATDAKYLYKLDPVTLKGDKVCSIGGTIVGMAMNYKDGKMYGIELKPMGQTIFYYLVTIDLRNGSLTQVSEIYASYTDYGLPYGGIAIDDGGNISITSYNTATGATQLVSFVPTERGVGQLGYAFPTISSIVGWTCYDYCSMTYDAVSDGIYWANTDSGHLLWLEPDTGLVIDLGLVGLSKSMRSLYIVRENEPAVPEIAALDVTISSSYQILVGGTQAVNASIQPSNSTADVSYEIADTTIASVDANGLMTGLKPGETTLTVTVDGYTPNEFSMSPTLTVPVKVVASAGKLMGFMLYDLSDITDVWISVPDTDPTGSSASLTYMSYDFKISAADYYDGYVYAVGQGGDKYDNRNFALKIDPADLSYTILSVDGTPTRVPYDVLDMAFDYQTGTMYTLIGGSYEGALGMLNLETGEVTLVGDNYSADDFSSQALSTLACDNKGQLYAISRGGSLYKMDKTVGNDGNVALTMVGSTGAYAANYYQSMTYDYNSGNCYWAQIDTSLNTSFRMVDLATGTSSNLGTIGPDGAQIGALISIPKENPTMPASVEANNISIKAKKVMAIGDTEQLTATIMPVSVLPVTGTVTWETDNEGVASVDENGKVTAIGEGVANITASVNGHSATCKVTVSETRRSFYGYDTQGKNWISFSMEDAAYQVVKHEDDSLNAIAASAYNSKNDTIYAYDTVGNFFTVDPDTFERTAIEGADDDFTKTEQLTVFNGVGSNTYTASYKVVDMSYDAATDTMYVLYWATAPNFLAVQTGIKKVDMYGEGTDEFTNEANYIGKLSYYAEFNDCRPANLLALDGTMYFIDDYTNGMLNMLPQEWGMAGTRKELRLVPGYWWVVDACGFIQDPLSDTVYAIRGTHYDNQVTGELLTTGSVVYEFDMNDASVTTIGTIGSGLIVNSLFIR